MLQRFKSLTYFSLSEFTKPLVSESQVMVDYLNPADVADTVPSFKLHLTLSNPAEPSKKKTREKIVIDSLPASAASLVASQWKCLS